MDLKLVVSSSPHIHAGLTTPQIMGWVLAALIPTGVMGVVHYGACAVAVIAVCVFTCVFCEYLWQKCTGRTVTITDGSAAVTGLLLAYSLPPTLPYWMTVSGSLFAIIVVKHFYGGIGSNIVNPALAGRAMMLASWPVPMTSWTLDSISTATPLALIKSGDVSALPSYLDLLLGRTGGCIGESCTLALIIGFAVLVWKDIIKWQVPIIYIAVAATLCTLFGRPATPLTEILSGGLFLGAIFMATDYTTTPITLKGQIIFAAGCGLLTAVIRIWGGYPEGVSYSILIMNLLVPLIDRSTKPRIFGEMKSYVKNR